MKKITVGVVGGPLIGKMQEDSAKTAFESSEYESISKQDSYLLGGYTAIDNAKVDALGDEKAKEINDKVKVAKQGALAKITIFPIAMLISYIALFFYFKGRGGYKSIEISGDGGSSETGEETASD